MHFCCWIVWILCIFCIYPLFIDIIFNKRLLETIKNTIKLQDTKSIYKNLLCSYILTTKISKRDTEKNNCIYYCSKKDKIMRNKLYAGDKLPMHQKLQDIFGRNWRHINGKIFHIHRLEVNIIKMVILLKHYSDLMQCP